MGKSMSADPVLVLQLQRLGDLVLTFPLLEDLAARYPGHPLLVAAEEKFYKGLEVFSPNAVFFPAQRLAELYRGRYEAVINLSGRPEAAICAGLARSSLKIGPQNVEALGKRIDGFWQIYRANLTQNNRHNTFHWSDLNRLDMAADLPLALLPTKLKTPRGKRIGLVVGASQAAKRPDALFWARLASRLAREGFSPIFLGGEAERDLGSEAARLSGLSPANLCGKLSLPELGSLMQGLALCVTPDTGPMHLASLLGVPTLNLSMGPVHANETGPSMPGQWVLRSAASCVGCWQCSRTKLHCKEAFTPGPVAQVAVAIIRGAKPEIPPGLELLQVERDNLGLLTLAPQNTGLSVRSYLEKFWRNAFLSFADEKHLPSARNAAGELLDAFPALALNMRKNLAKMLLHTLKATKGFGLPQDFWKNHPHDCRLFAGHCQLWLQNADFSREAFLEVLQRQESLQDLLSE